MSALLVLTALFAAAKGRGVAEPEAFSFVVYPGSRYSAQLTEITKHAHKHQSRARNRRPTAIYDTDAPVEQVAEYYAKEYGYKEIAPDITNNLSAPSRPRTTAPATWPRTTRPSSRCSSR